MSAHPPCAPPPFSATWSGCDAAVRRFCFPFFCAGSWHHPLHDIDEMHLRLLEFPRLLEYLRERAGIVAEADALDIRTYLLKRVEDNAGLAIPAGKTEWQDIGGRDDHIAQHQRAHDDADVHRIVLLDDLRQHRQNKVDKQCLLRELAHYDADEDKEDDLFVPIAPQRLDDLTDLNAIGCVVDDGDGQDILRHLQLVLHEHAQERVVNGRDAIAVLAAVDHAYTGRIDSLVDEVIRLPALIHEPVFRYILVDRRHVGYRIYLLADERNAALLTEENKIGVE